MYNILEQRVRELDALNKPELCKQSRIGLEKECLRVSEQGTIASTKHPIALGSALTNPYITTDYSEALLEFITPPVDSAEQAYDFLRDIQKFTYSKLENEILWCTSMPCVLTGEDSIVIAEYGKSNAGMMKTVYRRGLGYRYSKMMQVIAGIHFNYSLSDLFWNEFQEISKDSRPFQDFVSENYFSLIRNLQRIGWIVPYLFGASPAVCKSFMDGIEKILKPFDEYTYFEPDATSLRMGDIGYQNYKEGKSGIKANYNSLEEYIKSLRFAINTPSEEFARIGVKVDGIYRQLNTNLLQIENEYYSSVRPKQITAMFEKPTVALAKRGIRYIELRSLDLNIFEPMGLNIDQLHFLEVLLVFCLLHDSPPIGQEERREIDDNQLKTAHQGRKVGLKLQRDGQPVELRKWAREIFDAMIPVAELFDKNCTEQHYLNAVKKLLERVEDPDLTPSARILREMSETRQPFYPYSMAFARKHAEYFSQVNLSPERKSLLEDAVSKSIEKQKAIESADQYSFDEFLQRYFDENLEVDRE